MQFLAGGVGLMFTLIFAEVFFLKRFRREAIPWREITTNINSGHAILWLLRGVEVLLYLTIFKAVSLGWVSEWHPIVLFLFTFVAFDFSYYWSHRTHHTIPLMWRVHSVHHQAEHFSLSMGIRNSYFSVLTAFPFFAWLAIVGVPLEVYVAASGLNYFIQFYNHNGVVKKSGWLEKILITPSHHRVHHGRHKVYLNKNHGGVLVIWDKLFGTFQAELDELPKTYGIIGERPEYNPLRANLIPLLRHFGWAKERKQKQTIRYTYPDWYLMSGTVVLSAMFIGYIYLTEVATGWSVFALLGFLFSGTILLGGIAEGQKSALIAWMVLTLLGGPVLFVAAGWHINVPIVLGFTLLGCHGFWGAGYLDNEPET